MPSSTSSSSEPLSSSNLDRPLPPGRLHTAALIAFLVCAALMVSYEMYWRDFGVSSSYRNSDGLWTIQRLRIDAGEGDRTVLIGSSRTLFNIQLDTWEAISGQRPIQLSLEGTSPLSIMEDLSTDENFTGTLLVGVAPELFFSGFQYRQSAIERYGKESPSQWLGQQISMPFEPYLRFYSFDYSLFTILKRQAWPERAGVNSLMEVRRLADTTKDRNTRMWTKVEEDEEYRNLARQIWEDEFVPLEERDESWMVEHLNTREEEINRAVAATQTLQNRGVDIVFVRHPIDGYYAMSEPIYYPRKETWDALIERTGAPGVHWMDHEELQGFWLPEWSHLSGSEADRYTAVLYQVIERELKLHKGNDK